MVHIGVFQTARAVYLLLAFHTQLSAVFYRAGNFDLRHVDADRRTRLARIAAYRLWHAGRLRRCASILTASLHHTLRWNDSRLVPKASHALHHTRVFYPAATH